jgi:hypothetical protein
MPVSLVTNIYPPEELPIKDLNLAGWRQHFEAIGWQEHIDQSQANAADKDSDGVGEPEWEDDILDHDPWEDDVPEEVVKKIKDDMNAADEAGAALMQEILPEVPSR